MHRSPPIPPIVSRRRGDTICVLCILPTSLPFHATLPSNTCTRKRVPPAAMTYYSAYTTRSNTARHSWVESLVGSFVGCGQAPSLEAVRHLILSFETCMLRDSSRRNGKTRPFRVACVFETPRQRALLMLPARATVHSLVWLDQWLATLAQTPAIDALPFLLSHGQTVKGGWTRRSR